ncbi:hypothetical protein LQW54_011786 [Pestalotiopsis sp. IQ-011]
MTDPQLCNDRDIGPIVASTCRGGFDFTLLFEQTCFSLVIAGVSTIAFAARLWRLRNAPNVLPWRGDVHLSGKIITSILLVACNALLLAYWAIHPLTAGAVPSAAVELVASLILCALSYKEHCATVRPSFSLGLALVAATAGQAVLTRTLWLIPGLRQPAILTSVALVLRCSLLVVESWAKTLPGRLGSLPRESLVGPIPRAFLWWLNEILARGWKDKLSLDHLFELDSHLDSKFLRDELVKSTKARRGLLLSMLGALRWPLFVTVVPRLLLCAFNMSQPLLVEAATEYLSSPGRTSDRNTGYGLIGVTAIIYLGIALTTAAYKANLARTIAMMRGALVASIYHKTLELPKDIVSQRAATTLMSTDIERIAFGMTNAHEAWASPLEVAAAIYLLVRQIGYIAVAPVAIAIVCSGLVYWIATLVRINQKEWNEAVEKRVGETSTVMSKIEGVKAAGLTDDMKDRLQSLRVAELEACKRYRRLQVAKNVLSNTPALLSPFLTFVALIYSSSTKRFDASTAFTTLAVIQILTTPVQVALTALPVLVGALGCFDRIEAYLNQPANEASQRDPQGQASRGWEKGHDFELNDVCIELEGKEVVHNFTHSFPAGSISLIVGPSGSGKSTILNAMLAELPLKSGMISAPSSSVAYCSQEPWVQNSSMRDAICGEALWEQHWYNEVIQACFPNDPSEMPGDGTQMSEGQRKKLVLARAVYSRAPLILLDDCFHGMDHSSQLAIASRLLGRDGLLRRMQQTVILTASSPVLSRYVDHIITLSANGTILPASLQHSPTIDNTREETQSAQTSDNESALGIAEIHELHELISPLPSTQVPRLEQPFSEKMVLRASQEGAPTASELPVDDGGRTVNDRDVYRYYLRTMGSGLISLFFGIFVIEIFLEKFPQAWLDLWVTAETQSPGRYTVMYLSVYGALAVLGMAALGAVVWLWFVVLLPKSANKLHYNLLNAVMGAPMWFFTHVGMGNIINRFSQDMELVDMDLPYAFYHATFGALLCLATIILISAGGQYVAVIIPFSMIFVYALQKFYLRTSRQLRLLDLETKAPLYDHFLKLAEGVTTIRAFGWSDNHFSRLLAVLNTSQRPFYLLHMIQRWLNLVLDLFVAALAVVVMTMAVMIPSGSSSASLGLALINILNFNVALAELIDAWTILETSLGAVARLISFEKSTPVERLPLDVQVTDVPRNWPSRGAIEVQNLICGYGSSGAPVLKSINLTIQPGEVVGIDGASGSGKSTLLKSFIGLSTIQSGFITVDGLPITKVDPEMTRSRIITVLQDPFYIPSATLRSALIPLPSSTRGNVDGTSQLLTDESILGVLADVQLLDGLQERCTRISQQDAPSSDPATCLSSPLSDLNLSQRERQLLGLARACLQSEAIGSGIVLFDEPIVDGDGRGDLDVAFERIVKQRLDGFTVIVASHRAATLRVADRVFRLEQGSLTAKQEPASAR